MEKLHQRYLVNTSKKFEDVHLSLAALTSISKTNLKASNKIVPSGIH